MNGAAFYKTGVAAVRVHFPNGKAACRYCRLFCRYEEAFRRYSCRLTEDWLPDALHTVGERCPLRFEEGEK